MGGIKKRRAGLVAGGMARGDERQKTLDAPPTALTQEKTRNPLPDAGLGHFLIWPAEEVYQTIRRNQRRYWACVFESIDIPPKIPPDAWGYLAPAPFFIACSNCSNAYFLRLSAHPSRRPAVRRVGSVTRRRPVAPAAPPQSGAASRACRPSTRCQTRPPFRPQSSARSSVPTVAIRGCVAPVRPDARASGNSSWPSSPDSSFGGF